MLAEQRARGAESLAGVASEARAQDAAAGSRPATGWSMLLDQRVDADLFVVDDLFARAAPARTARPRGPAPPAIRRSLRSRRTSPVSANRSAA